MTPDKGAVVPVGSRLTPEAEAYGQVVEARRQQLVRLMDRLPIAVLIWGPSPAAGSPVSAVRQELRSAPRERGHLANFSEELMEPESSLSIMGQQLAQGGSHDIVFSLPDSPGSIAEIHDFFRLPGLGEKIVAFL